MSRGVVLYAHDNDLIEYGALAAANAGMIKHHLGVPVCLVTDDHTLKTLRAWYPNASKRFDHVVIQPILDRTNSRNYAGRESKMGFHSGTFFNQTRVTSCEVSPFDETLLIDLDYLILDDNLSSVWGYPYNIAMNHRVANIISLQDHGTELHRINDYTIPVYWATVTYFRKSEIGRKFFEIVEYVKANYVYFAFLFRFGSFHKTVMYRNDFVFAIAAHIMNGYRDDPIHVGPLPSPELMFAWDKTTVERVERDTIWIKDYIRGKETILPIRNQSFHCMNKMSLQAHVNELIRLYA